MNRAPAARRGCSSIILSRSNLPIRAARRCRVLTSRAGIPETLSANNLPVVVYQPTPNLTPNVSQWNFTLERQISKTLVLRGGYVGSRGDHLNLNISENVAVPGPGAVAARQPYPNYGTISAWEPRGPSNYDGLQLTAEKRMSYGLSFLARVYLEQEPG